MEVDPKKREALAQLRYEESNRGGVAWTRRPEFIKDAYREAAERELRERPGNNQQPDPSRKP